MNLEPRKGVKEEKKSATSGCVSLLSSCFSRDSPAAGWVAMLIFWLSLRRVCPVQKKVEGREELMGSIHVERYLAWLKNHTVPDEMHY